MPVSKKSGDKLFAGGKQLSGVLEIEALASVSQSYLTQLWSNDVFNLDKSSSFKTLTDKISKNFTIFVLSIAFLSTLFWLFYDASKALNVFTAVLIIACPCAIALAAPFTLGNLLRIFGKKKFYLKNATVIEQLASINSIIFDKTGTLTTSKEETISYNGTALDHQEKSILKSALRASNHPLSRALYKTFAEVETIAISNYKEVVGHGIEVKYKEDKLKLGSSSFVNNDHEIKSLDTSVHISFNNIYNGKFTFKNSYRKGVNSLFRSLNNEYDLAVLSGDNEGEKDFLQENFPKETKLLFNQKPNDKLEVVAAFQKENKNVAMIGDGLNDAGALAQSNVGISLSENINVFSPACDAILDASQFDKIEDFFKASKKAMTIIKYCFLLSLCYNVVGLYFAVTSQLRPVVAAILMPLSSISVVVFSTISTNLIENKIK